MAKRRSSGFGSKWGGRGPSKKPLPELTERTAADYERILKKMTETNPMALEFERKIRKIVRYPIQKKKGETEKAFMARVKKLKRRPHFEGDLKSRPARSREYLAFVEERFGRRKFRELLVEKKYFEAVDTEVKRKKELTKTSEKIRERQKEEKKILSRFKGNEGKKAQYAAKKQFEIEDRLEMQVQYRKLLEAMVERQKAYLKVIPKLIKNPKGLEILRNAGEKELAKKETQLKEAKKDETAITRMLLDALDKRIKAQEEYEKKRKKRRGK